MGDDECIESVTPSEEHACRPVQLQRDNPALVSRETAQQLTLSTPSAAEIARWPRYCVLRRTSGSRGLFIYRPEASARQRYMPFSGLEYSTYLRAVGRQMPSIDNGGSWGPSTTWDLPLCHFQDNAAGERELIFDTSHTYTFRIFNLCAGQPSWERYLKRTLMGFPIEHAQWGRLRSVYLDFFVGSLRIGLNSQGTPPRVASGGAYWPNYHPSVPVGRRRVRAQEDLTGVLCMSYAALNRPWAGRRGRTAASESQIDLAYNNLRQTAFTLYHEFGHIFHYLRPAAMPSEERVPHRAITRNAQRNGPFDRYRVATYSTAGASQGTTEGVAEAYRTRLQGHTLRGDAALRTEVDALLDQARMPTRESAARAQQGIMNHVRREGW